uniref:PH domain-containing protein n=1 Tax=Kalanchoe fedtschenkoi TaxID=63787 RepID=A0A7N0UTG5_KALFE
MDDRIGKIQVFPDHFLPSTPTTSPPLHTPSPNLHSPTHTSSGSKRSSSNRKKFQSAVSMLNLFSLREISRSSDGAECQEKVQLTAAELLSLQSEIASFEEREALAKARLEHVDKILQAAHLSGYLCIRTRWAALPGELPPVDDDTEIDDRLPRFVVLHGTCIFFYLFSTDISPQDSCLLSDIIEIGSLPNFTRGDDEMMHSFYVLTNHGLRYECSSASKIQVSNWLKALQVDCNLMPQTSLANS